MSSELETLIEALAPEVVTLIVHLVKGIHGKDEAAMRAAFEEMLRLQFEARNFHP